jgi:hypothetical protein
VHDDLDVGIIPGVLEQQNELIAIKGKKKVKHHLFIVDDLVVSTSRTPPTTTSPA